MDIACSYLRPAHDAPTRIMKRPPCAPEANVTQRAGMPEKGCDASCWSQACRQCQSSGVTRAAQVYPHGSTDSLPYATMGSGSLNAMAVFEEGYKDGLERDEAVALVARAIRSGIFNDLGSGSNVDVCVITRGKVRGFGASRE